MRYYTDRKNNRWSVYDIDGNLCSPPYATFEEAKTHQLAIEAKNGAKPRSCMNCRTTFDSDGPQNRLCPKCRKDQNEDALYAISA